MKTIGFRRRLDGLVEFGNDQKLGLALACKRGLSARDRDKTEMFEILFETRPRRDLARFSRDQDETETIKIKSRGRLEAETSRPRLHPWPKLQTCHAFPTSSAHAFPTSSAAFCQTSSFFGMFCTISKSYNIECLRALSTNFSTSIVENWKGKHD